MSIRDGLLAVLSLGPAYGLQLHAELASRSPHRGPVNVGQIYATLDRLATRGLVVGSGSTPDGLPLHSLTGDGERVVREWLSGPMLTAMPDWTEMLDHVVITATLDAAASLALVTGYEGWWRAECAEVSACLAAEPTAHERLALLARAEQGAAALRWLADAAVVIGTAQTERPLSGARPKRGRRPAAA